METGVVRRQKEVEMGVHDTGSERSGDEEVLASMLVGWGGASLYDERKILGPCSGACTAAPSPPQHCPKCECRGGASAEGAGSFAVKGPIRWEALPRSLRLEYTMQGQIPPQAQFSDGDQGLGQQPQVWTEAKVQELTDMANRGENLVSGYCHVPPIALPSPTKYPVLTPRMLLPGGATSYFQKAFRDFPVKDKTVMVVGSIAPWVETLVLMGGPALPVTTVDFNPPISEIPRIKTMSVTELHQMKPPPQVDVAISYSSLEHDGLGRYGDRLHPFGDVAAMAHLQTLLKPGGLLYLGVPVGADLLVFNLHRVYGPQRLPKLIEGWTLVGLSGSGKSLQELFKLPSGGGGVGDCGAENQRNWEQPVLILCKPPGCPPPLDIA